MIKISTSNSKLGLIPSVNLPPVLTCRANCPCAKDCYAMKGRFRFKNIKQILSDNLRCYLKSPSEYFDYIKHFINNGMISYSYFRWHASGDFVDEEYFNQVVYVARDLPQTSFLAFTKKYEMINSYILNNGELPSNLHIIFSAWGDTLKIENPYNFPIAYVRFKDENLNRSIPSSAVKCSGDCTNCLQCWKLEKGNSVVFDKH